jgi:hypothetical protein
MLFDSFEHVEYAFYGPNNRNKVVKISQLKELIPEDGADHYVVLFRYESGLKKLADSTGSVKNHDLPHYPDYVTFDIDNKDNVDVARQDTLDLVGKLETLGVPRDFISVSFSGYKGFHVQVPSSLFGIMPDTNTAKAMRTLCIGIAYGIKLDTGIYDKNRLFRVRNTKNSKSGLYKVNIDPAMLLGEMGPILAYAEIPQPVRFIGNNHQTRANLSALWKKAQTAKEHRAVVGGPSKIEVPKNAKACIHKMLQGVPNGMIHNAGHRLANHFFKQGFPLNVVKGLLEGWGPLNEIPADENFRVMAADAGQYDYGCNDDLMSAFCDEKCYLYKQKSTDSKDIMDMEAQYLAYIEYIKSLKQKCFITGHPALDYCIRGVAPGEVMIIIAYSGNFKSALLQHLLLEGGRRTGLHHLFFSLEMPVSRVFERSVQMMCEIEGHTIENKFKDSDYQLEMYNKMVATKADKLLVCQKSGVSVEQVISYTNQARQKYGDIGAIGIDYLGLMSAPGKQDEYSRISHCAEQSKFLAKELNVPVILLSQVNRGTAGGEVEKSSAKGSGAIEASADFLLGLQRDDQEQLTVKLLKNRKGVEGVEFDVEMEREYLKFVKLRPAEKKQKDEPRPKGRKKSVTVSGYSEGIPE